MEATKYYIDARNKSTLGVTYYDACSKPHADAESIALKLGFEPRYLLGSRLSKLGKPIWKKVLLHAYNLWHAWDVKRQAKALRSIHDRDIFVQYGFTTEAMFDVVKRLKKQGNRIIMLIHDLETFRFEGCNKAELELLQSVDVLIVHSIPMRNRVLELGFKGKVVILQFFDYLINDNYIVNVNDNENVNNRTDDGEQINIVFAGNLSKSEFVKKLPSLPTHPNLHFNLYGLHDGTLVTNDHIHYKGVFKNDDISAIEGNWGLVWDGDSLDTCAGVTGEYLRINAPFKFSLYLAKGLPVIVWEESAMAHYVEDYGVGIKVKSLDEIHNAIAALSEEEIRKIRGNVATWSDSVRRGEMLENALLTALHDEGKARYES